jgi:hypothetical protein
MSERIRRNGTIATGVRRRPSTSVRFPSTSIEATLGGVPRKKRKLAEVTEESLAGWQAFSLRHGTTPTSLAEALGRSFGPLDTKLDELPELLREVVIEARRIAADSRLRPRSQP